MADMIGPLRVLSTWNAAENARHFRLLEVAQDVLVIIGVLNRAREAVDLGPARRRLALRRSAAMASRPITISVGWARGRPC